MLVSTGRIKKLTERLLELSELSNFMINTADAENRRLSAEDLQILQNNQKVFRETESEIALLKNVERMEQFAAALRTPPQRPQVNAHRRQPQRKRSSPKEPQPPPQPVVESRPKWVGECEELSGLLRRIAGINDTGDRGRVIRKYIDDDDSNGGWGNKLRASEEDR